MKNQILYLIMLLVPMLNACSDWLDITASTDADRADMIASEDGFKQMLYGVYLNMTEANLYGNQLSYGMIETCARNYTYTQNQFSSWNYTDPTARTVVDGVWSAMYNAIVNINSILKDIDDVQELFTGGEWKLMKGEALALRAFLHFDLLRMFAPNYVGNEQTIAIPYVKSYERVRYPHIPAVDVIEKIRIDLANAATLLLQADDPALSGIEDNTAQKGNFFGNRRYRMNYWAVRAIQARVELYAGNTADAATHASAVLSSNIFPWVDPAGFSADKPDRLMLSEVIFALDVQNLSDYNTQYFKSGLYSMGDTYYDYTTSNLFDDANDYRYLYLMMADAKGRRCIPARYDQDPASSGTIKLPTIPLIRKGEMQMILAECKLTTDLPGAIELVRELRFHRGYLLDDRSIPDGTTADQLKSIIIKELRKDTHMEGQTFFNYKRNDLSVIPAFNPWSSAATISVNIENYTLPLPESEKEYGNIPSIDD